ncbi:uncharacterized protein LOC126279021 [Schistocerca gregaria]|uniref:uncharacterized protein LOC126279021 n=1 Tax=Schistocerca gregaria TaxID=7010 RepID=UPI00211E7424|nr:uncharacterized protein LOC126279021 [Schistocerca gregaria]
MKQTEHHSLLGFGASIRRLLGLWWYEGRWGRIWSAASASVTLFCLALLPTFSALKLIMDIPPELEEIALCCFVICICSGFLIKAAFFIYQGDSLKRLLKLLSDTRRVYRTDESKEDIRHSYLKLSRRVSLQFQFASLPTLAGWVSTPLLARIFLSSEDDSIESNNQFPVPLWFPGNMYLTPTYEILYGIQSFSILVATQVTKLNVKVQGYKHEEWRLKIKRKNDEMSFPRNENPPCSTHPWSEDVSEEKMCLQLVKNIQHHQEIIKSFLLLQSAMNVSIFTLLFVNMADLCSCIFVTAVLLQRDGNVTKALKPMLTIPPLLYETGIYCIFGQIITDQSEKLMDSAISSGWVDCDARFKQDLLFFLMAASKPLEITVGKLSKLSRQMLVQVLNGSYGLLNLLYHFHSNQ